MGMLQLGAEAMVASSATEVGERARERDVESALEDGEATVEAIGAAALRLPVATEAQWSSARAAIRDGRVRVVSVAFVAFVVATGHQSSLAGVVAAGAFLAGCWLLAAHVVERSLRLVSAVAGQIGMAACSAAGGSVAASAISFWMPAHFHFNSDEIGLMGLASFLLLLAFEMAKVRIAPLKTRVLLVGGGHSTRELIEVLAQSGGERFAVVGIVQERSGPSAIGGIPVLGRVGALARVLHQQRPDLVVVSVDRGRPDVFERLAECAGLGFRVVGLAEFYEHAFARVPLRHMTDAWFMSILHLYQRPYTDFAKRTFDVVVALFGLIVAAPLFLGVSLLVRLGGGPVFYRQTRLGGQGKLFTILKFRTMRVDAETNGAVWAQERDPRVTGVGHVLRALRLDELPQLINVLRGEMSIVGPRPERPEFLAVLQETVPFWSRRHLLKPGITGWAQVRAGYAADVASTEEKLAYDLWYLRHRSLVVDFLICARTLPAQILAGGR